MERDRRRFTPDGRPRAEPGETGEGGTKAGGPAPAEPRPPEETGTEETGTGETGSAGPSPSGPPPVEPAAGSPDAPPRPAAPPPQPEAPADSKPQPPPAAAEEPAPPGRRAGNEGREHLAGFVLTLADTYLRVIAARAAEPVFGTDGAGANRRDRAGPDPLAQAFVGLEQVVSFFRLLTEPTGPAGPGADAGSPDAEEVSAGDSKGDPRLGQLVQLLLAHADFSLRVAAAPPAADPTGDGEPDAGEAAAALRGAEALGAFQEVIGMLEALEQHTRSRRTEEEGRMVSRALYQLRMDYLALAGAPSGAPAGP